LVRAQVHSSKHYFQMSLFTVLGSAINNQILAQAEAVGSVLSVSQIREGSTIKAVFVELWVRSAELSPGSFVVTLEKVPGAVTVLMSVAESSALGTYDNKKNILFTSQALTNENSADAIPILRDWIKIPKSKQRFGLKDQLVLNVHSQAPIDNVFCGFSTYKEYF